MYKKKLQHTLVGTYVVFFFYISVLILKNLSIGVSKLCSFSANCMFYYHFFFNTYLGRYSFLKMTISRMAKKVKQYFYFLSLLLTGPFSKQFNKQKNISFLQLPTSLNAHFFIIDTYLFTCIYNVHNLAFLCINFAHFGLFLIS